MGFIIIFVLLMMVLNVKTEGEGPINNTFLITEIYQHIKLGLEFVDLYYKDFNLDALIGIIITKVQLNCANKIKETTMVKEKDFYLQFLIEKCKNITFKIKALLFQHSKRQKVQVLEILLREDTWIFSNNNFNAKLPSGLGIYENWNESSQYLGKSAKYMGVKTDFCLQEIFETRCKASDLCKIIMFSNRIDTGYLLTHRLLYLNLADKMDCLPKLVVKKLGRTFCSLMYKEAMTNDALNFPRHDIFFEQVVFCGLNDFGAFLNVPWVEKIMNWQLEEGCFKSNRTILEKRTSNLIEFGCSNHATGLGIAAMAISLHKLLQDLN